MSLTSTRKTLTGKATNLRELRIRCRMSALKQEELEEYFVDTKAGRNPNASIRTSLKLILEDAKDYGDYARVLVYGHGGCGKSTELVQLSQDLAEEFFIVRFSIDESGDAYKITPEEILLLLTENVIREIDAHGNLTIGDQYLQSIYSYFETETRVTESKSNSNLGASAEAEAALPLLPALVKLLGKLKADMTFSTERRKTVISKIRKRSSELIDDVRLLVEAVNATLDGERELLVIVEDLDKLDIAQARRLFVEEGIILTQVPTHIIYTIPVFLIRAEDAAVLASRYKNRYTLPMIKTLGPDGVTPAEGFDLVRQVILKRVEDNVIEPEALDLLIRKTGGLLQHAFDVLHHAALQDNAKIPLSVTEVRHALERKKTQFWTEIGVPEGLDQDLTNEDLYARLAEIAKNQLSLHQNSETGTKNEPSSELVDQILLKQAAIIQYNGSGWIGVHPLVLENLHARGDIHLPAAYVLPA